MRSSTSPTSTSSPITAAAASAIELVREMIEHGPYAGAKWLLHTEDAHELYRRFGFERPERKVMERAAPSPE